MTTSTPTSSPDATSFADEYRHVDGIRLHALVGGNPAGKTVVLLAGFPQDARAWLRTAAYLAQHYRLVIPEIPGQGRSDRPADGYDTQTMATRVHGLLHQLGVSRYALVAHDVGAWTAFPYALLHGDEIECLALLDAGIPGITLPESVPLDPERAWKTWHFAFHQVPDLPEVLLQGHERDYIAWFLRNKTHHPDTFSDAEIDAYADSFAAAGGVRAGLAYYREAARSAEQNRALLETRRFTMPVVGVSAQFGSIADMAAPVRPYADDARNVVVPDSGHFIPDEQPELLADALREFIG
ncbi:alpha/beta hydrolase [Curtobacterium sp. MCPF17_047]|uniref:alpha/beta fold hydrolase n=1 Tax=Curtobacterium sp. MCPF17_047 TaxID=2175654 RepID=UPI000DA7C62C|nr:alpha/beta hydrolase [Curtobacterium sp. MCPF17_047]PZF66979.1 alpha/beta hydrolase [Curtobacterium sp. MCPF17_047]